MAADTFKMGTLLGLIFFTLVMGGKIMIVESAVYSSPDTAMKFSQCLIEKMRQSPHFTMEDQNSMFEFQDIMAQSFQIKNHSSISAKILLNTFFTSIADIIILDNDVVKSNDRKTTYLSALEQCSLSPTGETDVGFISEAQKILTVIETDKAGKYGGTSETEISGAGTFGSFGYSQASGSGNPLAVQPAPVKNPLVPQKFYSNDKTIFGQQGKPFTPPIAAPAQINLNPQRSVYPSSQTDKASIFGKDFQVQSGNVQQLFDFSSISKTGSISSSSQRQNFPIVSDASGTNTDVSGIPQSGLSSSSGSVPFTYNGGGIPKTHIGRPGTFPYAASPQFGPINEGVIFQTSTGGLNIPQTKESPVVVIPPKTNQQFNSDERFFQNPQYRAEKPINQESAPKVTISEIPKSLSVPNPQAHEQYSDYTSYPELKTIVMNILKTSPKFRKAFNPEISQQNAINLARALTEQAFSDYNLEIMNDALSVVTEEVTKVRVPSPETFAFALSNALVLLLTRHGSSLPAGDSQLPTSFLSGLDDSGKFYSHREIVEKKPQYYNADMTLEQSSFDNSELSLNQEAYEKEPQDENPGVTLEQSNLDNSDQIYSQLETDEELSQDDNTDVTLEQFYPQQDTVEKQSQDYQEGEADDSEFSERQTDFDFQSPPLSPEDRKDEMFSINLSRCLSNSDAIRNFFCDHNEPDDVVQISFSIIKASLMEYGTHVAPLAASVASGALSELSKEGLCNNYAKTISEIIAEILEENGIKNANFESIARKMEQDLIQRQIIPTESQKPPTPPDSFPPKVPETETYEDSPELESSFTPVEKNIPHYQVKTEHPDIIAPPDYEDVSDYEYTHPITLSDTSTSLFTATPTMYSEDWAPDGILNQQAFTDYLTEMFHTFDSYDSKESEEEYKTVKETSAEEFSKRKHRRRRKNQKFTTPQLDIATTCPEEEYEEGEEVYDPTVTEDEDNHQDEGEIPEEDIDHKYSRESDVKITDVELQPSFQDPMFDPKYSTGNSRPSSGITPSDSGHTGASLSLARQISEIAESSSAYIRSGNFVLNKLCPKINQLAPLVNIPILDYCEDVAALDYLLNVLQATVKILKGA